MTQDLLRGALDEETGGVLARPTLAADARRGARKRQLRTRVAGAVGVVAVAGTVLWLAPLNGDDGGSTSITLEFARVTEVPLTAPLSDFAGVTFTPAERAADSLGLVEALDIYEAALPHPVPGEVIRVVTPDRDMEGSFGVLGPSPATAPGYPTPSWRVVVHDVPLPVARLAELGPQHPDRLPADPTCDVRLYVSAENGLLLSPAVLDCTPEQQARLDPAFGTGGQWKALAGLD